MDGHRPADDQPTPPAAPVRAPEGRRRSVGIGDRSALAISAVGLLILACLYTLYVAQPLILPIIGAIVLKIVLAPMLRLLVRLRIPRHLGAAVIVSALFGGLVFGLYSLWEPVGEWRLRMPQFLYEMEIKLEALRRPVEEVTRASEEVERIANLEMMGDGEEQVVVMTQSLPARIVAGIRDLWAQILVVFILLYFLLASDSQFKEKLVRVMPTLTQKKRVVTILRQVEREVSTYLLTITVINLGLGCAIGIALHLAGVPNAAVWGVMAALLNYLPYVGALIGATLVAVVSLLSFDTLGAALVPPAIYIGLNVLESQFVTPNVLGQRFTLNPVIIFTTVVFWGWLWGAWGALMAVPILVVLKAFSDHVGALAVLREFLSGGASRGRDRRSPSGKRSRRAALG